jgi:hypothetical protein
MIVMARDIELPAPFTVNVSRDDDEQARSTDDDACRS